MKNPFVCDYKCIFCPNPCYRSEVPRSRLQDFADPLPLSKKEIKGVERAFDAPLETGLAVVENVGSFEVTKNVFGKEKVRRVK